MRHQPRRQAQPNADSGIGGDLPANIRPRFPRRRGENAAFLRVKHAGLLAALIVLECLDRSDEPVADLAIDDAVIVAGPCQVGLKCLKRAGAIALTVSAGVCAGGRAAAGLFFALPAVPPVCAWAYIVVATIINAAAIVARMAAFASVETALLKHICLVGNSSH